MCVYEYVVLHILLIGTLYLYLRLVGNVTIITVYFNILFNFNNLLLPSILSAIAITNTSSICLNRTMLQYLDLQVIFDEKV